MTTQPQPEALRLAEAMKQRVIPRWVHATGETPRQSGFAADAECQAAAAELLRLHAECEELRMERDALRAAARHGGWAGYIDSDALRADAERWRFARDNIVAFYETTGHWRLYMLDGTIVYEGTASSYQGAIDAARAAKEQA